MAKVFKYVGVFGITLSFVLAITACINASQAYAKPIDSNQPNTQTNEDCKKSFFGLVPWYQYIEGEFYSLNNVNSGNTDSCTLKCFNFFVQSVANECGQTKSDLPAVLLAIVDDLLRIAGFVAFIFVIVGSVKFVLSQGKPEQTASAQSTLINALLGLGVAIIAIAFVSFIGNRLGG